MDADGKRLLGQGGFKRRRRGGVEAVGSVARHPVRNRRGAGCSLSSVSGVSGLSLKFLPDAGRLVPAGCGQTCSCRTWADWCLPDADRLVPAGCGQIRRLTGFLAGGILEQRFRVRGDARARDKRQEKKR